MAQMGWVYLDNNGGRHRVGLYHGDDTGHLVIHCNMRVVQIDFSVKETTSYSFMIDDELCEVHLVKEPDGRFGYEFKINKSANTPRNQGRRKEAKRNRLFMGGLVLGLIALLAGVFVLVFWWRGRIAADQMASRGIGSGLTPTNERRLRSEGQTAVATLLVVKNTLTRQIFYSFTTHDNLQVTGQVVVPDTGQIQLPNGFALADNDQFSLRYAPGNPQINQVDFRQPAPKTLARYLVEAALAEQRAHPGQTREQAKCVVETLYGERGLTALADVVHQSDPPQPETLHHRDTYQRLVRDPAVGRLLQEQCWK